ncbi:MAG: diadenylate cyclase CdaA [Bacteroidia bacterium]
MILLFNIGFIEIRLLDVVDIILVAILIYFLYKLVRGTIAFNIFIGFLSIFLLSKIVEALNMQLLSEILGEFIGVGVLALLIVFQQEVRRFLLIIGKNSFLLNQNWSWQKILPWNWKLQKPTDLNYTALVDACRNLSRTKTGALIVIAKTSELRFYASTGTAINGDVSTKLLESIFNKKSPLHDGAVVIAANRIKAAGCILPVSESETLPHHLGMRHRSGLGISEQTDAVVIIISEERGSISIAQDGKITLKVNPKMLQQRLQDEFYETRLK